MPSMPAVVAARSVRLNVGHKPTSPAKGPSNSLKLPVSSQLLVIDAVQVVGLVVRTGQSWPAELANISEQVFGLLRILLALFQWQAIALTASMVIVWASLINAGLVAWAFAYNKHQWIFPIRTLGVLVAFATSIGFIPLLEQLLLAIADPSSLTSDSVGAVVLRAAAAVSAVLFVPFALTGSLLVFEGDPGSTSSSMRAPSGSINALVTTARCVFVVVAMFRFDANSTWLANFVFLVVAGVVLAAVVTRLPYYLHWPSRLQAALYAGIAWIALGTLVLDVVRRRLDGDELTNEATIMDIAVPWVIATGNVRGAACGHRAGGHGGGDRARPDRRPLGGARSPPEGGRGHVPRPPRCPVRRLGRGAEGPVGPWQPGRHVGPEPDGGQHRGRAVQGRARRASGCRRRIVARSGDAVLRTAGQV